MTDADAATALEALLLAENAALERHDAGAAVALLDQKLAAAKALAAHDIPHDLGARLHDLAARNQILLERAMKVQGEIVAMVVRAAQGAPASPRYGAAGRAIPGDSGLAMTRHA